MGDPGHLKGLGQTPTVVYNYYTQPPIQPMVQQPFIQPQQPTQQQPAAPIMHMQQQQGAWHAGLVVSKLASDFFHFFSFAPEPVAVNDWEEAALLDANDTENIDLLAERQMQCVTSLAEPVGAGECPPPPFSPEGPPAALFLLEAPPPPRADNLTCGPEVRGNGIPANQASAAGSAQLFFWEPTVCIPGGPPISLAGGPGPTSSTSCRTR